MSKFPVRVAGPGLAILLIAAACSSSTKAASTATSAAAAASAAAASTTVAPSIDLSSVTLNVGEQGKNVITVLTAAGLQNTPYKISYSEWPTSAAELQGLTANAADIGLAAAAPTINAIAVGAQIQATVAVSSNQATGVAILVPQNSPIKTVADLKGKNVSPTTKGSIGQYVLLANLAKAGLGPDDVKVNFLAPTDARAAFTSGAVDAWTTWDPYLATAEIQDHARVLADTTGLNAGLSFLDATNSAINNPGKHAAIQDLINRLQAAELWTAAHLPETSQTYSKLYNTPLNIATVIQTRGLFTYVPNTAQVEAGFQQVADLYFKDGVIPKAVQVAPYLNHTFTVDPSKAPATA